MKNDVNLLELLSLAKSHKRYILGIDGLSRSGKTTFVGQLHDQLKKENMDFCIFHIDDHIMKRNQRYGTGFEQWYEYIYLQWDVEWLSENFFEKLRESNHVELPFYHNETDTHEMRSMTLPKSGIIIIEGVFLQRKEWKDYYDKIVFLDCSREKRFAREAETTRNNLKKFEERYWKAEEYYINTCKPLEGADIVVRT
ncbi:kinase [Bacillus solimangrovi]|uniref:Uridine kinase n=1 Tax=Bacillus solimangrovi TaxID=1305675 RepID=A0A1E5LG30_9BACI|nr:kinase [Bacillus solimangrovi]OEH93038.1 uridine kinase [Bacillus solimangrovi]